MDSQNPAPDEVEFSALDDAGELDVAFSACEDGPLDSDDFESPVSDANADLEFAAYEEDDDFEEAPACAVEAEDESDPLGADSGEVLDSATDGSAYPLASALTETPRYSDDDLVLLELWTPEEDEEVAPGLPRGLMPALIATGVLHIWLLVMCQSIFLQPEPHRLDSVIDSRLVEAMQPEKIEQVFEYQLAKPVEDRDIPLQPIVNAMSVGQSETRQPKPESLHEPSDILDPTRSRDRLTDIPEGVEVDERVVVKGNTGDALIPLEAALDRVTWEIARNLQEQRVLVVWLLDASGSLQKQRQIIADRLDRIYGELGALQEIGQIPRVDRALLTGVVAYGEQTTFLTREPTADFEEIKQAIQNVEIDPSGKENVFTAVHQVVEAWKKYRTANGRRIMLIAMTDESGDDFDAHEPAIVHCRKYGARAYVLGPHAVFGRREGYFPYVAPENGRTYNLPVDLGPETAMYENVALPFWFNGPQYEYLSSGFGPYGLSRLVRETGGVYFATNMTTMEGLSTVGFFDSEVMKAFEPDYSFGTARAYLEDLTKHPLRLAVVTAARISRERTPEGTPSLDLRVTPQNFRQVASRAQETVAKSTFMIENILAAFPPDIEKHYEQERSLRWRMAYNLSYGRLLALQVRCYEYNYACASLKTDLADQDVATKANHWIFRPDAELNYAKTYKKTAERARTILRRIIDEAPGTPWALLAARELQHPLGIQVEFRFIPPPPPRPPAERPANPPPRLLLAPEPRNTPPAQRPKPVQVVLPKL